MKCILHIGTEKTGTTTLQAFLDKNRENLLKEGIAFTRTFGPFEHYHLATFAMRDKKTNGPKKRAGIRNAAQSKAFCEQLIQDFRKEVAALPQNVHTLVFSSERCHSSIIEPDEFDRLKELLSEYCDAVQIIAYIRPQHEVATSLYTTKLKNGRTDRSILPAADADDPYYNYLTSLGRWSDQFGDANMTVRLFASQELKGGDVVEDFCSVCGWDSEQLEAVERQNESLNEDAQKFLLMMNEQIPTFDKKTANPYRANLFRLVGRNRYGKGLLPAKEDAMAFFEVFKESNEKLRQKWFPEREELFNVNFDKFPEDPFDKPLELERAFEIFADLWRAKQREIARLRVERDF